MIRKRRLIPVAVTILTSALALAADPPPDLIRLAAEREAACQRLRDNYTYRQTVLVEEIDPRGGRFRETRDIIFSPSGERSEKLLSEPASTLKRLILTPEDFHDIRHIQPMLLTPDLLPRYNIRYRGEETVEDTPCWVLEVTPRQLFHGFRMFDGLLWIGQRSLSIVRVHGQAVPAIQTTKNENLFPRFTTIRERIDGGHYFPVLTYADDILPFRSGPLRMRLTIRYLNYQRFTAGSTITFPTEKP